jgi:hypothetical protein
VLYWRRLDFLSAIGAVLISKRARRAQMFHGHRLWEKLTKYGAGKICIPARPACFPSASRAGHQLHGEQGENEKQRELRHGFGQCSQSNPHDRQSGHRVIEVSSAGSPFGLKTISFLDLSFTYAVCDV